MPASLRILTVTAAAAALLALPLAAAAPAASAAPAAPAAPAASAAPAAPASRPGLTAKPITLANKVQLDGYDAATDASGKSYIGWISSSVTGSPTRSVHLCTLPPGATRCSGGIQTESTGQSSAVDLRVLVTPAGKVTLVWFHDTTASENGPNGSEIAIATSQSGGPLSAPQDVATAPSFGSMLDATLGPNGSIWTVAQPADGDALQIRPGLTNPAVKITAPYVAGTARLRFSGSTGVLVIQKDGAISLPVSYASERGGSWSGFRKLAHTWTAAANLGLADTRSGIRVLASVSNADYYPVVSRWTGSSFTRPTLTGDRDNCAPESHDPVADASGRMADVSLECQEVAVANLTDTLHAAIVRFHVSGTFAQGNPQLTTTPRGRAWVVWSTDVGVEGARLQAAPVLLPGRSIIATRAAGGNRVTLHGPASCLPPVDVAVSVKGSPAAGWQVTGRTLLLGSRTLHSATLRGGSLTAGRSYTLKGRVTFASGGSRRTVTAKLKFRSCPTS